jgi:hypothetical protein
MGLLEVRDLRQLRDENARLKRLVADLTVDRHVLQGVIKKRDLATHRRRDIARWIRDCFQMSVRRAPVATDPPVLARQQDVQSVRKTDQRHPGSDSNPIHYSNQG